MYFRLRKDCYLIMGAKRGAIYDLQTNKVYSINRLAADLLMKQQYNTFSNLVNLKHHDDLMCRKFFDRLTAMGIGGFYFDDPGESRKEEVSTRPSKLNFLWLEITSACNNSCIHCYASSGRKPDSGTINKDRWLSLISEARQAGATALQLIGGEPLMVSFWRELINKASQEEYQSIEIFTNATLIDDDCISYFKDHGVHVATTIYAGSAPVHDRMTKHKGSFEKTVSAVEKLLAAKVPVRIASIITKINEHEVANIQQLCTKLGVRHRDPDVVRPTGRGDNRDLLPEYYHKQPITPPFYTSRRGFAYALKYNSCLAGKIAITPSGDVIPCIFDRDHLCGNVSKTPLKEILGSKLLQEIWEANKDKIEKCRDCEYRYACRDCRPLAQGQALDKAWNSCPQWCLYNPYTGEWGGGDSCKINKQSSN